LLSVETRSDINCGQVEVIKCRAQNESGAGPKTLGSLGITKLIAQQEGFKGEYEYEWRFT
jgi:hypothetical protein